MQMLLLPTDYGDYHRNYNILSRAVNEDFMDIGPVNITLDENTTSVDISLILLDDQIRELDEYLVLNLETSEDPNVVILAPAIAVVTILDNDGESIVEMKPQSRQSLVHRHP